jgi:cobalt-zinc-cadmium efflux system outer membrane protein
MCNVCSSLPKTGTTAALLVLSLVLSAREVRSQSLTLPAAIEMAEKNNPLLQSADAGLAAATAGMTTARAYPNPGTTAMAGRQMVRAPGNLAGFSQLYGFTQPIEFGELRRSRLAVAERFRDSASLSLEARRLAVLTQVRRAFFEVLRRQGEVAILLENLKLVEELRQRIQVRVDVGEAARLELVRAEAEVATSRSQVNSARLRVIGALSGLRAAVGTPIPASLTLQGSLDPPAQLPPLKEMEGYILERHPVLRLANAEVQRAEARLTLERASRRPQPSFRGEYERVPDVPSFRVGIDIPLPLWNRREGPIAEAVAIVRQVRADESSRRVELLASLEGSYRAYELAGEQISAFEVGVLKQAEAALSAAEVAYRLGERGILEVLDAQRLLRTSRLDYLNAQFDRQAALVNLDELRARDPRSVTP